MYRLTLFHHDTETSLQERDTIILVRNPGLLSVKREGATLWLKGAEDEAALEAYPISDRPLTVQDAVSFIKQFSMIYGLQVQSTYEDGSTNRWFILRKCSTMEVVALDSAAE